MILPFVQTRSITRCLAALENAETNIMVTDEKFKIRYMNKAVRRVLTEAETDIKSELPHFDVAQLIGSDIDRFYTSPSHQGRALARLKTRGTTTITIGSRSFELVATPIRSDAGRFIGSVVEWFDVTLRQRNSDNASQLAALNLSQAIVEFRMDGTIVGANANFLDVMGYRLDELVGKNQSFLTATEHDDSAARAFRERFDSKRHEADDYIYITKSGKEVCLRSVLNVTVDRSGAPFKIVQYAMDVTTQTQMRAESASVIDAISRSQGVIAYAMDGTVLDANANFLHMMGYEKADIVGRHHMMFLPPEEATGAAYKGFWRRLAEGTYQAGEFRRIGRSGREVWIQASYNPIFGVDGKPCKVVKYASDVTKQVLARKRSEYINGVMHLVANGAKELDMSVRQIADAMGKSKDTTQTAVEKTEEADKTTSRLAEAAKSMGGIVAIIGRITGQIDLLALNATIEAARAGDAGRGFAVVASEVKMLANEARKATDLISDEIGAVRAVASEVVGSLAAIKDALDNMREYVASTSASVTEQSAVANEMSFRMQKVAAEAIMLGA